MKSVFLFLALIAITHSSELQELSNTDVEPVVNLDADKAEAADNTEVAVAPEHDEVGDGQFGGGGFGGALLTTGSFTMMAASGGFEEEEELGESQFGGGGFGGALLTTGSFTMMAASGGFEEEEELGESQFGG